MVMLPEFVAFQEGEGGGGKSTQQPPEVKKPPVKKTDEVANYTGGGECPRKYRAAWRYTSASSGQFREGHSPWMCECRAEEIADAGNAVHGDGTHWVEKQGEDGGEPQRLN